MCQWIPSKDYRKFLKESAVSLSDWELAALIYNNPHRFYPEKAAALAKLREATQDESLKVQLEKKLFTEEELYKEFQRNSGNACYVLSVQYQKEFGEEGLYLDFAAAHQSGMLEQAAFRIEKKRFQDKTKQWKSGDVEGCVEFQKNGEPGRLLWLCRVGEKEPLEKDGEKRFEDRYPDLPLLFRRGDLVHVVGTERYGIVDGPENDEEEMHYRKKAKHWDYSDFQVPVNLMYDGKRFLSVFSHDHIAPTELEYAELDEKDRRKGVLEYMKKALYETSFRGGSGRDVGRIREILAKLEQVWRQYPDMRLGQLLINVCGKTDLFMIEDEEVLERLEKNIFPILK